MALVPLVGPNPEATSGEVEEISLDVVDVRVVSVVPTVLVVDSDSGTQRDVVVAVGHAARVIGAPDAYQALAHLRDESVDLVVLEIFLPGADGLEVLRRIRTRPDPPRVVIVTHSHSSVAMARALGADAVLTKPAEPDLLAETLRRALAPEGPAVVVERARTSGPRPVRCVVL